ncbi:hypothetical protein CEXT_347851 [Caerostris extrusa]|uniref:Uncharacterized protein n=1 Tax=Caerostris extrusa TaxID=172846 RepID=A0AAV4VYM0_CAEEX|nr:hypothetical protein CEXT_347851 [Caerostris extrusa]
MSEVNPSTAVRKNDGSFADLHKKAARRCRFGIQESIFRFDAPPPFTNGALPSGPQRLCSLVDGHGRTQNGLRFVFSSSYTSPMCVQRDDDGEDSEVLS